ncbi:hypothetical protein BH09PSE1_BH09PSE1_25690 [soil metagenome]
MADFILLMHDDATSPERAADWDAWFAILRAKGAFQGGSAIGRGASFRKVGAPGEVSGHLNGFVRVTADSLAEAQALLAGNPVYEAGGTVEIRELPRSG